MNTNKEMEQFWLGDFDFDFDESMRPLLKIMGREISKQKRRLGGDFAVAFAVATRCIMITSINQYSSND